MLNQSHNIAHMSESYLNPNNSNNYRVMYSVMNQTNLHDLDDIQNDSNNQEDTKGYCTVYNDLSH